MSSFSPELGHEQEPIQEPAVDFIGSEQFSFAGIFMASHTNPSPREDHMGYTIKEVSVHIQTGENGREFSYFGGRGERIANEMLRAQTTDVGIVQQRQDILDSLLHTGKADELHILVKDIDNTLCKGLFDLFIRNDYNPDDRYGPQYQLYDLYDRGYTTIQVSNRSWQRAFSNEDTDTDDNIAVAEEVDSACNNVERGVKLLRHFAGELAQVDNEGVQATATKLLETAEAIKTVVRKDKLIKPQSPDDQAPQEKVANSTVKNYEKGDSFGKVLAGLPGHEHMPSNKHEVKNPRYFYESSHGGPDFAWVVALKERLEDIGSVLKIAQEIDRTGWQPVTFDESAPDYYTAGRHLKKLRFSEIVANDSPASNGATVLSSANGTGKTHYMETDMYIRLLAQSIGFAPVEVANLRPFSSFLFLGRVASSGGYNDQGAFKREVRTWQEHLSDQNACWYLDEGASTTSPEEQSALLASLAGYIINNGGAITLATHNEQVPRLLEEHGLGQSYHFESTVTVDGDLTTNHVLKPGSDDSKFIALARARNFPEHLIRAMDNPTAANLNDRRAPVFPALERYSTQERQQLAASPGGLAYMFPAEPTSNNPLLVVFGQNHDMLNSRFSYRVDNALFHSARLTAQELFERQFTLAQLSNDNYYVQLQSLLDELNNADFYANMVTSVAHEKNLLAKLNPLLDAGFSERGIEENVYHSGIEPEKALAWLKLISIANNSEQADLLSAGGIEPIQDALREHQQVARSMKALNANLKNEDQYTIKSKRREYKDQIYDIEQACAEALSNFIVRFPFTGLPSLNVSDCSSPEVLELLSVLAPQTRKGSNDANNLAIQAMSEPAAMLAMSIKKLPAVRQALSELRTIARQTDSVHLHQAASQLDSLFATKDPFADNKKVPIQEQHNSIYRPTGKHINDLSLTALKANNENDSLWRDVEVWADQMKSAPYQQELERLSDLAALAQLIAEEKYAPVKFNETGTIKLNGVTPISHKSTASTPNNLDLGLEATIAVLASSHGSGKTYYQKAIAQAVAMAQTFGYAPATFATMPLLDRICFVERIAQDGDTELSAGMQEIEYWKQAIDSLQTTGQVLVVADELGSSTSPAYQSRFIKAVANEVSQTGNKLIFSTHNHEAARDLLVSPGVSAHHFDVEKTRDDKGVWHSTHSIKDGLGESGALEAAQEAGLPEEIITTAREILARHA